MQENGYHTIFTVVAVGTAAPVSTKAAHLDVEEGTKPQAKAIEGRQDLPHQVIYPGRIDDAYPAACTHLLLLRLLWMIQWPCVRFCGPKFSQHPAMHDENRSTTNVQAKCMLKYCIISG